MKKAILAAFLISFSIIGCTKEELPMSVEVIDYASNQPLEHAEVKREAYSRFDFTCLCTMHVPEISYGFTDQQGRATGMSSFTSLKVSKENYYDGGEYNKCFFEKTQNSARIHMFKKGLLEITAIPGQIYSSPLPYMEIYPVLRDGSVIPNISSQFYLPGNSLPTAAFGNIKNRILVLKGGTGPIPDTLSKTEIFLPEGTIPQITIHY